MLWMGTTLSKTLCYSLSLLSHVTLSLYLLYYGSFSFHIIGYTLIMYLLVTFPCAFQCFLLFFLLSFLWLFIVLILNYNMIIYTNPSLESLNLFICELFQARHQNNTKLSYNYASCASIINILVLVKIIA